MHEDDKGSTTESDVDFLQYTHTKLWVVKVNREGCFLNNDSYMLFRAMELAVCQVLDIRKIGHQPTVHLGEIMNDPGVMAHWSCLLSKSVMLESEVTACYK